MRDKSNRHTNKKGDVVHLTTPCSYICMDESFHPGRIHYLFSCDAWKSGIRFTFAPFITPLLIASFVSVISFFTRL